MSCKHCIHNQDGHKSYCNGCSINPEFKNNFRSGNDYYPLELRGTHIILWLGNGEHCISIAIFDYSEEDWTLAFVGNRPLLDGVNWDNFRSLVEIGFNMEPVENNE